MADFLTHLQCLKQIISWDPTPLRLSLCSWIIKTTLPSRDPQPRTIYLVDNSHKVCCHQIITLLHHQDLQGWEVHLPLVDYKALSMAIPRTKASIHNSQVWCHRCLNSSHHPQPRCRTCKWRPNLTGRASSNHKPARCLKISKRWLACISKL